MNIAFVCNRLYGGGAERFTTTIANQFKKQFDYNVFVVTGPENENDYDLLADIHRFSFIKENFIYDCVNLLSFIKENKIDVIISIGIYTNLCLSLCAIFTKVPCIISERNSPKHASISWKTKCLRKLLFCFADGFVFQTKDAQEFYSKSIQRRSVVIHNPIKEGLPEKTNRNKKEFVAAGRLYSQKNYKMLIKAFAKVYEKYSEYRLRIFGDGGDLKELQEFVKTEKLTDCVIFEGFTKDIHSEIKDSMIFCMSSDFEGMPNALMEAMAMGFPVISTDCPIGGPAELINNNENGILIPVGDVDCLKNQMIRLIEDGDLRNKLSYEAKKIMENHNVFAICNQWNSWLKTFNK